MHPRISVVVLFAVSFVVTACDARVTITIRNGTDQRLLVTIADPIQRPPDDPPVEGDLESGGVELPPGGEVEWHKIWGGGPPVSDLGQLRATTLAGELVYERDLLLSNSDDGCRITISSSIGPLVPADCR